MSEGSSSEFNPPVSIFLLSRVPVEGFTLHTFKLVLIDVCIIKMKFFYLTSTTLLALVLLGGLWLYSQRQRVAKGLFTDRFIYREDSKDEFMVVPPQNFDWEMVNVGKRFAETSGKLLVVSLVRNCESSIPCMEKKMGVLSRIFREVHVAFFENNSSDKTRERLLAYSVGGKIMGGSNVRVTVINPFSMKENELVCASSSKTFINNHKCGKRGASNGRIGRMAILRNKVLDYVYEHQTQYTNLLITDMDIIGRWFSTGIMETIGYLSSKEGMGFVTFRGFFDTGGFFDPFSYKGTDFASKTKLTTLLLCMKGYFIVPSGKGLYPVESSHSGGVFANLPLPPSLKYEVQNIINGPFGLSVNLCEHIPFMEKMKTNYVNTNMSFLVKDNV